MSFQNIKGQDKAINILQGYIRQGCLSHGYLFTGPEGVGKAMAARELAKALNCESLTADSCDSCPSCVKIAKNEHPDVYFIGVDCDAIKIEYVRQLQRNANLKPYEARKKVFIINNAHNLTAEAANATLKILEEPPQDSVFILVSAKPALLFKTIISRCKVIKFSPLERSALEGILRKDYGVMLELAHFLAYFSEGRIGRALQLKDTEIFRGKNQILDSFLFSARQDAGGVSFQDKGRIRECLNILAAWFRDIALIKIGMPYTELINSDRREALLKSMNRYSFNDLDEILKLIANSLLYLEQNVNVKLLMANLQAELMRG